MTAGIVITVKNNEVKVRMPFKNATIIEFSLLNQYLDILKEEIKQQVKKLSQNGNPRNS